MSEHILESHWEDDNGVEWDIRVMFDYQPSEPEEYDRETHTGYPGCDSSVTINAVERETIGAEGKVFWRDIIYLLDASDGMAWLELECHDHINKQAEEARDLLESAQ